MVRKQVPCRSCLECCFHTCRLASPCHALGMGNPCADVATAFFRRFVARPVIFIVTTVPWGLLFDWFMLLLGPALICLATSIVGWVIYAGLYYVLPLKAVQLSVMWWAHVSMAMWLGFNILFNYYCCARTNPGTHDSPEYQRLVSEARADGKIHEEAAAASSSDEDAGGKGGWMNRGPFEWGWDYSTRTPKAPRAHYDHVSKKLVLNMDHYCPWMFNCVGYLNYRHFVLFMMYTWMGCAYVALETLGPFLEFSKSQRGRRHHHKHPEPAPSPTEHYYRDMMKHNYEASGHELSHMEWSTIRRNITFTFMITLSVGIAITLLLSFHIYLTLSAQTTIEFYGNRVKSFRARRRGEVWQNPYDQGMRRNWEQVFGKMHPLLSILPARRAPAWPPYPGESSWRAPPGSRPAHSIPGSSV